MNVGPIASLNHHTLYMGNLVPAYTMYHTFPCKDGLNKLKTRHRTDLESDQLPETEDLLVYNKIPDNNRIVNSGEIICKG